LPSAPDHDVWLTSDRRDSVRIAPEVMFASGVFAAATDERLPVFITDTYALRCYPAPIARWASGFRIVLAVARGRADSTSGSTTSRRATGSGSSLRSATVADAEEPGRTSDGRTRSPGISCPVVTKAGSRAHADA
jgi:hypothetical protein